MNRATRDERPSRSDNGKQIEARREDRREVEDVDVTETRE